LLFASDFRATVACGFSASPDGHRRRSLLWDFIEEKNNPAELTTLR
jgi:hypothetical protein